MEGLWYQYQLNLKETPMRLFFSDQKSTFFYIRHRKQSFDKNVCESNVWTIPLLASSREVLREAATCSRVLRFCWGIGFELFKIWIVFLIERTRLVRTKHEHQYFYCQLLPLVLHPQSIVISLSNLMFIAFYCHLCGCKDMAHDIDLLYFFWGDPVDCKNLRLNPIILPLTSFDWTTIGTERTNTFWLKWHIL